MFAYSELVRKDADSLNKHSAYTEREREGDSSVISDQFYHSLSNDGNNQIPRSLALAGYGSSIQHPEQSKKGNQYEDCKGGSIEKCGAEFASSASCFGARGSRCNLKSRSKYMSYPKSFEKSLQMMFA